MLIVPGCPSRPSGKTPRDSVSRCPLKRRGATGRSRCPVIQPENKPLYHLKRQDSCILDTQTVLVYTLRSIYEQRDKKFSSGSSIKKLRDPMKSGCDKWKFLSHGGRSRVLHRLRPIRMRRAAHDTQPSSCAIFYYNCRNPDR